MEWCGEPWWYGLPTLGLLGITTGGGRQFCHVPDFCLVLPCLVDWTVGLQLCTLQVGLLGVLQPTGCRVSAVLQAATYPEDGAFCFVSKR